MGETPGHNSRQFVAVAGFLDDVEVVLDERAVAFLKLQGLIQPEREVAFVKLVRGPVQIHVHQQHVSVTGLGERGGQAGGDGADPGAGGATGQGHEFGFVVQVVDLEVGDDAVAQDFPEGG